jgi:large repetitive protein
VTAPSFHPGEVRITYADVTLSATGGKPPYTWSISGALPGGLTLSGAAVGGTPTAVGAFGFTVQATDSSGMTASAPGTITVANYLAASAICAKLCSVEDLCNAVCGTYAKPSGGVAPFKFGLASGVLPTGVGLGWPALTGQFSGVGNYSFSVSISDSLGASIGVAANFSVFAHIAMKVPTMPTGKLGAPYAVLIPYSGGSGAPTAAIVKGALPPGLSASVDSVNLVVNISGTPTASGTYAFVLRLTDASPCAAGANCFDQTGTLSIAIG